MRTFTDQAGRTWDVAVERESWGTFVLIFTERRGPEVRRSVLASRTVVEAHAELAGLDEAELLTRLAEADPCV